MYTLTRSMNPVRIGNRMRLKLSAPIALLFLAGFLALTPGAWAYKQQQYFMLEVYPRQAAPYRTISHLPPVSYYHYYGGTASLEGVALINSMQAPDNSLATFQEILKRNDLYPGNYRELDPDEAQNRDKARRIGQNLWYR